MTGDFSRRLKQRPVGGPKICAVIDVMVSIYLMAALLAAPGALENARDRQDRAALEKQISELSAAAQKAPHDADAQYRVALASSYLAEVSLELRDKSQAERVAQSGIQAAGRAIAIDSRNAEYYRVLGTLCGQVVPARPSIRPWNSIRNRRRHTWPAASGTTTCRMR